MFAHRWYIGTDDIVDDAKVKLMLDEQLKLLNDDYRVERISALKEIFVNVIPTRIFYQWMEDKGKVGGQNKFPRVLRKNQIEEWEQFIQDHR
jgi:hypothetical protein